VVWVEAVAAVAEVTDICAGWRVLTTRSNEGNNVE